MLGAMYGGLKAMPQLQKKAAWAWKMSTKRHSPGRLFLLKNLARSNRAQRALMQPSPMAAKIERLARRAEKVGLTIDNYHKLLKAGWIR